MKEIEGGSEEEEIEEGRESDGALSAGDRC
jgi:hypothetical protein